MYALDFEYDRSRLSDFGFIICEFDSSSSVNISSIGSKVTFNTVSRNNGKQYSLIGTEYGECISSTFDICKDPDMNDDMVITDDEYRMLARWLNRRQYLRFKILDESNIQNIRNYNASFNISKIKIGEILYGLRLEMFTDSPFSYGDVLRYVHNFENSKKEWTIMDMSDDIGYIYPHVRITLKNDGDLIIFNDLEKSNTVIKNCKNGEIIELDGNTLQISTTYNSHDICNDFNYDFFRIGNTINTRCNKISVTIPCKLEIEYYPTIKDSP